MRWFATRLVDVTELIDPPLPPTGALAQLTQARSLRWPQLKQVREDAPVFLVAPYLMPHPSAWPQPLL